METASVGQALSDSRYVTLVVRVRLDRQDRVVQGEIVAVDSALRQRFVDLRGLIQLLRRWMADDEERADDTKP